MDKNLAGIRKVQDAELRDKVVLVRVDHNVVKEGMIKDPFRIDITLGTMFNILAKGGKLILMTHVGRPRDKKTGEIKVSDKTSVEPIVSYLQKKLYVKFSIPEFEVDGNNGLKWDSALMQHHVEDLRSGKISGIYLPNTRWFRGEEDKGKYAAEFAAQLAEIADIFVNDAFGSWQPHVSTVGVTKHLPSYSGRLMQNEIIELQSIFQPEQPLVAVVAGSKFDTKIGPLRALLEKADYLMLGGVIYNAYLAARYKIKIAGLGEDDIASAEEFLEFSKQYEDKIIEPPVVIESDTLEGKRENQYRKINIHQLTAGDELKYILDVAPEAFEDSKIKEIFGRAKSFFVNAVMGLTPHFPDGTIALFDTIDRNSSAYKMFAGGDTLQEFRILLPGKYLNAVDDSQYYFFSGGGTILTAIEEGSAIGLEPVKALMD